MPLASPSWLLLCLYPAGPAPLALSLSAITCPLDMWTPLPCMFVFISPGMP